ncbi:MAG: DEAD/DEAH box helicase [Christensenellales bacterium]|jgi:DEAD/DEAH box helicase domain-containing protein
MKMEAGRAMNLTQLLEQLHSDTEFCANVTCWHKIPARPARYAPFPDAVNPALAEAYRRRGIHELYTHQREALDAALAGEDFVVVTPTASGKTLCYNLPVLQAILDDQNARALYLFPTKALSADQVSELYEVIGESGIPVKTYTYDGDTPVAARKAIRQAGHIVVTNPDMLHAAILPHHTKWVRLFENLRYVVIDEIHTYRGVFGSHLANVIRRLKRLCAFYGAHPQFICCSATIANPAGLAQAILGRPVRLIDDNGAPAGERHFIFCNPPVVNRQLGIRKSALLEARRISTMLIANRVSTIVFARSRVTMEVLLSYLKKQVEDRLGDSDLVRGYRGGYLPGERRDIERGLRSGRVLGVVSTNALELGIDIGSLSACVLCGYPGTIASTWQQSGRAGRRNDVSLTVLVANSSPLNQYIVNHPEYFFGQTPENGLINPDNLYILLSHIQCAAFELPFRNGERFGDQPVGEILGYLEEQGTLRHVGDAWHWSAEEFPSTNVSLRSASNENFVIIDVTGHEPCVIGQMDRFAAPMLLHEEAIYIHEGRQYQVEKLDFFEKKAFVRAVDVDYYTDANLAVSLRVLDEFAAQPGAIARAWGEVLVTSMVTIFKKIKFDTHENIGFGRVNLPELEMHTTAYWMSWDDTLLRHESERLEDGLTGVANLLAVVAPMYLMCDPRDIAVVPQIRSPHTRRPTIYIYDCYPGGIGLSEKLYELHSRLAEQALELLDECPCLSGCPSCVGPDGADKAMARRLLSACCL